MSISIKKYELNNKEFILFLTELSHEFLILKIKDLSTIAQKIMSEIIILLRTHNLNSNNNDFNQLVQSKFKEYDDLTIKIRILDNIVIKFLNFLDKIYLNKILISKQIKIQIDYLNEKEIKEYLDELIKRNEYFKKFKIIIDKIENEEKFIFTKIQNLSFENN